MLPRYKISIDQELSKDGEKLGMTQIAYTANPAIITKGVYFNRIEKKFTFADELKLRVAAPALIPDLPIYRQDEELGEYEVVFDKETIEQLRQDFMLNKGKVAFNLDHSTEEAPSYILDSWITGPSQSDPSFTKYGIELPEGSWFVVSQFTDKDYFQKEIIEKDRIGYSIEGFLGLALNKIKQKLNSNKMEKQKFEKAVLDDGTAIFIAKNEVGGEVYVIDENGDKAPLLDGEHKLKDGSSIVTVDGKITEIKPAEVKQEAMADAPATPATDKPATDAPAATETKPADAPAIDEAAILAVVQPKLDELYKIIADLKTIIEQDVAEDATETDVAMKMNSQETLMSFFKANK